RLLVEAIAILGPYQRQLLALGPEVEHVDVVDDHGQPAANGRWTRHEARVVVPGAQVDLDAGGRGERCGPSAGGQHDVRCCDRTGGSLDAGHSAAVDVDGRGPAALEDERAILAGGGQETNARAARVG